MATKLKVKQVRSVIGRIKQQKLTIQALGLRNIGQTVVHNDNAAIRGMIETVKHLVEVEEIQGE